MSAVSQRKPEAHVLVRPAGALRIIVLNRPEALNSLSLEMIREVTRALEQFERDPQVGAVLIRGAGERGLCAGGDIRRLYQSLVSPDDWPARMWAEEYALNAFIASYPKPYIAFMDGIVMGGGVGVSAHARYRIVTERTKVAMPEVGIGLFPDIGGTWLLSRAPGEIGTCMALSGMTIGAGDAIFAGLADTNVSSSRLDELESAIAHLPLKKFDEALQDVLLRYNAEPPAATLAQHRNLIDACLSADTVEKILSNLEGAGTPFAADLVKSIRAKSPTSLKVTLRLLRLARASASLEECLKREYAAVLHATAVNRDFKEGIRAAVIDKDRSPKWQPSRLEDVSEGEVGAYLNHNAEMQIPFRNRKASR